MRREVGRPAPPVGTRRESRGKVGGGGGRWGGGGGEKGRPLHQSGRLGVELLFCGPGFLFVRDVGKVGGGGGGKGRYQ